MKIESDLDWVREDVEAKQRAILWEDARKGGKSVDEFLWKGSPTAKPVQRAGLVVFALMFLLLAIAFASIPFQKKFEAGWGVEFFMSLCAFLISMRLLRNAFLRAHHPSDTDSRPH
jgi:phosphotransferase system  glucose/maltose/N-acetylglucosamine-specific IIC component